VEILIGDVFGFGQQSDGFSAPAEVRLPH